MRKQGSPKREILPDAKYNSKLVTRLINMVMRKGKKSLAESIVYGALDIASKNLTKDPLEVIEKAVDNVRPLLEVKSRRVGGATYQVPLEVSSTRGITLALRWMRNFARQRPKGAMEEKLATEMIDAYKKQGQAMKKREDTHKMAEANKAFAHYRW